MIIAGISRMHFAINIVAIIVTLLIFYSSLVVSSNNINNNNYNKNHNNKDDNRGFEVVDISEEGDAYVELLHKYKQHVVDLEASNAKLTKDIHDLTSFFGQAQGELTNSKKVASVMERIAKAAKNEETISKLANENCILDSHSTIIMFETKLSEKMREIEYLKSQLSVNTAAAATEAATSTTTCKSSKEEGGECTIHDCRLICDSYVMEKLYTSDLIEDKTNQINNNVEKSIHRSQNNGNIYNKISSVDSSNSNDDKKRNMYSKTSRTAKSSNKHRKGILKNKSLSIGALWNTTIDNVFFPIYEKLYMKKCVDSTSEVFLDFYYEFLEDIYFDYFEDPIYFFERKFHAFAYNLVNYYDSFDWYLLTLYGIFADITSLIFFAICKISNIAYIKGIFGDKMSRFAVYFFGLFCCLLMSYRLLLVNSTRIAKKSHKIASVVFMISICALTYINEFKNKSRLYYDYDDDEGFDANNNNNQVYSDKDYENKSSLDYMKVFFSVLAACAMILLFKDFVVNMYISIYSFITIRLFGDKNQIQALNAQVASASSSDSNSEISGSSVSYSSQDNSAVNSTQTSGTAVLPTLSSDWHQFKGELVGVDNSKQFFPQRAFYFVSAGNFVIDQDAGDVGTIVWDAEVLLAHFMDTFSSPASISVEASSKQQRVLELGAGTALAAMVSARRGASVAIQELESVLPHSIKCIESNTCQSSITAHGTRWGEETISSVTKNRTELFDMIIMADVLYHATDFGELVNTITLSAKDIGSQVVICYEQRRRNVNEFFYQLSCHFGQPKFIRKYVIVSENSDDDQIDDSFTRKETIFYLYYYER